MRVLDCIADAYACGKAPDPPLHFLATRTVPVRPTSASVSWPRRVYKTVVERLRDALGRPARLATDGAEDEPSQGFHMVKLSPEDTAELLNLERPGTSRNMLMAAVHLAIGEWNLQHGSPAARSGCSSRSTCDRSSGLGPRSATSP